MRLIVAALCLLLAALPASALEKVTLQLNWKHQFQFAGYYAAIEKGYYRDAGLEVRIVEAATGVDPVDAVMQGKAEYGVGASELALRRARGEPVVALATILQHSPLVLLARKDQRISSVHDLADRRIMLMPHETELYAYLKRESVVQYQTLDHSFAAHDLIEGKVDALSGYATDEPFVLQRAKFPYSVFSPRSNGIDFYGDTLFTTEGRTQNEREQVIAFREASLRGWRYAMEHREEIVDLILTRYGQRHSRAHLLFESGELAKLMQLQLVEIGHMTPGRWQHIAETYAEIGMLPADFSIAGLVWDPTPARLPSWVLPALLAAALCMALALAVVWRFRRINSRLAREIDDRIEAETRLRATNAQLQMQIDETARLQAALHEQVTCDSLTGLYNRRYLEEALDRELQRAKREGHALAVIMVDIDQFKRINDTYGHLAGDQVLAALATLLGDNRRSDDVPCRYGGDRFLVLLPQTPRDAARDQAESWRTTFAALAVRHGELDMHATISLGVAVYPDHGHTSDELTQCADLALYLAKHDGRNRTTVFEAIPLTIDIA